MAGTMAFFAGDLYPGQAGGGYYNTSSQTIPPYEDQQAFVHAEENTSMNAHVDHDTHRNILIVIAVAVGLVVLPNIRRMV